MPQKPRPDIELEEPMHDDRRQLTFGEASNRALLWLIAGLISWLCYSTMNMQKQMAVMIERSDNTRTDMLLMRGEQQRLAVVDDIAAKRLSDVEIRQAQHGWH